MLELLKAGIYKGNTDPRLYAVIEDDFYANYAKCDSAKYSTSTCNNYTFKDTLCLIEPKSIKVADNYRSEIFLEPYKDYVKKVLFGFKERDWNFNFYSGCVRIATGTRVTDKNILLNHKVKYYSRKPSAPNE